MRTPRYAGAELEPPSFERGRGRFLPLTAAAAAASEQGAARGLVDVRKYSPLVDV